MNHTVRAFFAIVPPKELNIHLLSILNFLKHEISADYIRWINSENLHITLQFIGQLHFEHIASMCEKVGKELERMPSFQLKFGSIEWFPSSSHPKVLSLAAEPHEVLAKIANTIGQSVSSFNYPIETRPFRSHMSIGRVRHYFKKDKVSLSQIKLAEIPSALIERVYLIESRLGREKVTYIPLAQFKLAS